MISTSSDEKEDELKLLNEEYRQYKKDYMKHLEYDPETPDLSKFYVLSIHSHLIVSAVTLEHAPLEVVYIQFDTAAYDKIERDVKVTKASVVQRKG